MSLLTPKIKSLTSKIATLVKKTIDTEKELQQQLWSAVTKAGIPKGTSRAEIARRMGIKPPYLADLMSGRRNWNTMLVEKFGYAISTTGGK